MGEYVKKEYCLIWLDSFLGLEYKHKKELLSHINSDTDIPTLLENTKSYLISAIGENEYNTLKNSANREYLEFILNEYNKKGIKIITALSENYPKQFEFCDCPPLVLYYKGNDKLLNEELFGVVGSRKSLPVSLKVAERYTEELISVGFVPVTGIAEGVDSRVISTALKNGGKVISIVAGGIDHIYPKQNSDLIDKVVENGLVISEYPPSTVPKPFNFPIRNRIIAALSRGVLIVSGGLKSGTMYTAEYAEDFGKDLFAVPYSVDVPSGAGCNELIKRGALLTDTPQDILDFYGKKKDAPKIEFTDAEREIVRVLKDGALHIEKISALLDKRVFILTPLLSTLEIKGVVIKSGNVYGLTRNDLEV